jgi:hypothetical protein
MSDSWYELSISGGRNVGGIAYCVVCFTHLYSLSFVIAHNLLTVNN